MSIEPIVVDEGKLLTINDLTRSIDDLARVTNNGFKEARDDLTRTIDDLAIMVNNGFKEARKDLLEETGKLRAELKSEIKQEVSRLESKMDQRFSDVDDQLGEIRIRLSDHDTFKPRLFRIEKKIGIPAYA